jgi:hypothetical protein
LATQLVQVVRGRGKNQGHVQRLVDDTVDDLAAM